MASYLKPRRGKKATAITQSMVLKRGEVFFEIDENGITTGANAKACGKIKMGDGVTTYDNLGYFIDVETCPIGFVNTPAATETYQGSTYYEDLNAIEANSTVATIISKIKSLLFNLSADITVLSNTSRIPDWEYMGGYATTNLTLGTINSSKNKECLLYIRKNGGTTQTQINNNHTLWTGKTLPIVNLLSDTKPVYKANGTQYGEIRWAYMNVPVENNYDDTIDIVGIQTQSQKATQYRINKTSDPEIFELTQTCSGTDYFVMASIR